ncbi:MAG: hypothetical protein LQ337_009020, partial [Flavoplaca oasis]
MLLKKLRVSILNQSSCKDDDMTLNSKAVDNSQKNTIDDLINFEDSERWHHTQQMQDESDLFRRILINTPSNACEGETEFTEQQHDVAQQTTFSSAVLSSSQSSDHREKIDMLQVTEVFSAIENEVDN